jgi:hypothetical protein
MNLFILLFFLIGVIILFLLTRANDIKVFFISLLFVCLKLLLVIIDDSFPFIPYEGDITLFEITTMKVYLEFLEGNFLNTFNQVPASLNVFYYSYLNAFLMYIFGNSFIVPRLFNIFISSFFSVTLYKLSLQLISKDQSFRIFILFSFLPSYFLLSLVLMRDSIINLIFLMLIKLALSIIKRFSFINLFYVVLLILLSFFFRDLNPILIISGISFSMIVLLVEQRLSRYTFRFIYLFFGLILLLFLASEFTFIGNYLVNYLLDQLNYRASGGANYLLISINNIQELLIVSPWLYINFLFYPLFFNINSLFSFIFFIEGSIYLLYFTFALLQIKSIHIFRHSNTFKNITFMLSFFLFISAFGSLITANGGTALRQRMFIVFLIPLISVFLVSYNKVHMRSK